MADLNEIRKNIDIIDKEITQLLLQRYDQSVAVGEYKRESKDDIYKPQREREILERIADIPDRERGEYLKGIFKKIMEHSRRVQYGIADKEDITEYAKSDITDAVVAYQGVEGAYSQIAAKALYDNATFVQCKEFEDVFIKVMNEEADYGVIPIQNSTAGAVDEVYDLLLKYKLYIIREYDFSIDHCLCGIEGATLLDIKTVFSHPQALSQCSEFIKANGFDMIPQQNTAVCARNISQMGDRQSAAICSRDAAENFNLKVIKEGICNNRFNQTRFVVISRKLLVMDSQSRIRIVFQTANKAGALSDVLSIFSSYNVNLTHIYSRPDSSDLWSYSFYAEFEGSLLDESVKTLIYHLSKELKYIRILGGNS